MIKYLAIAADGTLTGIYNESEEGLVEMDVPEGYPQDCGWDAATQSFNDGLEKLRQRKRDEINALKLQVESAGAGTSIGVVDSDLDSRGKINGLVTMALLAQMASEPFALTFRRQDNSYHEFTDPLAFIQFGKEVGMHSVLCHYRAVAIKDVVDGATKEQLETFNVVEAWNAGSV